MMSTHQFDIIIVGAGPIGLACALEAEKKGLTCLLLEKGALVNSLYRYPLNMTFFSTAEKLEIGNVPFVSHNPKPTRSEALEYYRRVAMFWDLEIGLYEQVTGISGESNQFKIDTSKTSYQAKHIILATGFYDIPNVMNIPGEHLPKVHHYYKEAHPYFGQKIVVVGAANSAVDEAMETCRKGADVTMIIRDDGIRDSVKYWVKPDIENRIKEGSIRAFYNASLKAIRENEVDIEHEGTVTTLENDFVLAMTGYLPDFHFLESMGIQMGEDDYRTPIHDPETMMTNVPGIYLAGVICGGLKTNKWFIENSREHASLIVNHIVSNSEL